MISLMHSRKNTGKLVGAVVSAIIMLMCVVGLYSYEFNVSVESTADLERAINEYHFVDEVSADVLERKAIGNRLYVLYGENEYPGACGLACLEKGIFGNYRMVSCDDSNYRWINGTKITVGRTNYYVTYCAGNLQNIDAYGLYGVRNEPGQEQTMDDSYLICKLDYSGSPFLTFTELGENVTIFPYRIRYYQNGIEVQNEDLEKVLGINCVEDAPDSSTGTAELGLFYVLEGIIILLGMVFVCYFLRTGGILDVLRRVSS